jgi:hypothetical protein
VRKDCGREHDDLVFRRDGDLTGANETCLRTPRSHLQLAKCRKQTSRRRSHLPGPCISSTAPFHCGRMQRHDPRPRRCEQRPATEAAILVGIGLRATLEDNLAGQRSHLHLPDRGVPGPTAAPSCGGSLQIAVAWFVGLGGLGRQWYGATQEPACPRAGDQRKHLHHAKVRAQRGELIELRVVMRGGC